MAVKGRVWIALSLTLVAALALAGCSKKPKVNTGTETTPPPPGDNSSTEITPLPPANPDDAGAVSSDRRISELRTVYFDYDSADLSEDTKAALAANGSWLLSHSDVQVQIEGHCDERGTDEYNLALGDKRAQAVSDFLVSYGVAPDRLTTISYGEEKPTDMGHDESAWAKNRRAEFMRAPR